MSSLPLDATSLVTAAMLIVISVALLGASRVGNQYELAWGAIRTVAQLLMVGTVLRWIFDSNALLWVFVAFAVMLSVASFTAARRTTRPVPGLLLSSTIALAVGAGATTVAVTALVVGADPWWDPRYFLPLAGMIIGNAMNAAALTAERLHAEVRARFDEIEGLLALGASPPQSVADPVRAATRAGLVPTINGMMTVGLVSLPGMMTGQMIAGADPELAARYQIVVMFMLAAATAASAVILARLVSRRLFTRGCQLRDELRD